MAGGYRKGGRGTTGSVNGSGRLRRLTHNMNSKRSGHGTKSNIGRTSHAKRLKTRNGRV
jgi:hypothetical protein